MHIRRYNEATQQEIEDINQILNIARDEGYMVTYTPQPHRHSQIKTPFVIVFAPIHTYGPQPVSEPELSYSRDFYDTMCNIYDRLYTMGYVHDYTEQVGSVHRPHAYFVQHHDSYVQPGTEKNTAYQIGRGLHSYFRDGHVPNYNDIHTYDHCMIQLI